MDGLDVDRVVDDATSLATTSNTKRCCTDNRPITPSEACPNMLLFPDPSGLEDAARGPTGCHLARAIAASGVQDARYCCSGISGSIDQGKAKLARASE